MTIEEFNKTSWSAGMMATYHNKKYPIVSCDFEEQLIAIEGYVSGCEEPSWVRCENITLVA
ncbi:MAG: hypothetical protein ABL920_10185 [Methylotenera sp.]